MHVSSASEVRIVSFIESNSQRLNNKLARYCVCLSVCLPYIMLKLSAVYRSQSKEILVQFWADPGNGPRCRSGSVCA